MRRRYRSHQHSQPSSVSHGVYDDDTLLVEKTHLFLLGLSCLQKVGTEAISDVSRSVEKTRHCLPGPRCRQVVGINMSTTTMTTEGMIL